MLGLLSSLLIMYPILSVVVIVASLPILAAMALYCVLVHRSRRKAPTHHPKCVDVPTYLAASAEALSQECEGGTRSSVKMVKDAAATARAIHEQIRAVACWRKEAAMEEAASADNIRKAARSLNIELPYFLGVPCSVKECMALPPLQCTGGLLSRVGTLAHANATVVGRMRAMGFIPICSSNLSELCMWYESNNPVYGRTRNPYDLSRIVGGSSGGEAALIAASVVPCGLGSDVGGSIRMPAYFNGIFGHKPTGGLIPNSGQFPTAKNRGLRILTTGPLTRRGDDLAPLVMTLAGPDGLDSECGAWKLAVPPQGSSSSHSEGEITSLLEDSDNSEIKYLPSCPAKCVVGFRKAQEGDMFFAGAESEEIDRPDTEEEEVWGRSVPWWKKLADLKDLSDEKRSDLLRRLQPVTQDVAARNALIRAAQQLTRPLSVDWSSIAVYSVQSLDKVAPSLCTPVSAAVRGAVAQAIETLSQIGGCDVGTFAMPELSKAFDIWSATLTLAEAGSFRKDLEAGTSRCLTGHLLAALACGRRGSPFTLPAIGLAMIEDIPPRYCSRALQRSFVQGEKLRERLTAVLSGQDEKEGGDPWAHRRAPVGRGKPGVLILPNHPTTAPPHHLPLFRISNFVYTALFNALGLPATAVPLGLDSLGHPVGVQVVAAPGWDLLGIAVARFLEKNLKDQRWQPPPTIRLVND